jgi:hypothetical protein
VYEVLEQLGKAAHHLSEAQQDQSSKPRTVFAPAHRFVADGPSPRDIRRASVEEVFGTLMREAQNNVDARALVFNLTTLLGEPEGWPAEQVALFDRVLQQCAVSEADVAAMRTVQAGYRQSLGAVQAVFAGGARPTPTSQE